MSTVREHNGRVRYQLTPPWEIGAGLVPAVRLSDGGIELWVHQWLDMEGRVCYGYRVTCDRVVVAEDTDLRSGAGAEPDLDATLSSLLSFAAHYAEHTDNVDRGGYDSDPIGADDRALGDWYAAHKDELWQFQDMGDMGED